MVPPTEVRGSEQFKIMPDFGARPQYSRDERAASPWDKQSVQNDFLPEFAGSCFFKQLLVMGILVFIFGLFALNVSCCVLPRKEAIGEDDQLKNRQATQYSETLNPCLEASTLLICLSGLMMAGEMLLCFACRTKPQAWGSEEKGIMGGGSGGDGRSPSNVITNAPSPAAGVVVPDTLSEMENVQVQIT